MKKIISVILCLILTAFALQGTFNRVSADTVDKNVITYIKPGVTISNYMHGGSTNTYAIKATKVGKLSITVTSYIKDDLQTSLFSNENEENKLTKNILYDINKNKIVVNYVVYVSPRTYYLTLHTPFVIRSGLVKIKTKFTGMRSSEGKAKNNTFSTAVPLVNHKYYRGVLAFDEDSDCYRIHLYRNTNFCIKVNCFNKDAIDVIIQDKNGNIVDENWAYYKSVMYSYKAKLNEGIYYITIKKSGRDNRLGRNYGIAIGYNTVIDKISIPKKKTLGVGGAYTLKPMIEPKNAIEKYSYKSSNTKVVQVSNNGRIKALKRGTATITVKTLNGEITSTCKVTVK